MSNNFFVILSKFQLSIQKGAIIMENIDKKYAETCIFLFLELEILVQCTYISLLRMTMH